MKKLLILMGALTMLLSSIIYGAEEKVLVVYFTRTGNTEIIAEQIQKQTNGDIFKIETVNPYPENYRETTKQAKEELEAGYQPPLKEKVQNLDSYDTVFLGYPIWWGTLPTPVHTFLKENNLSGKKIIPFCTHGGSNFGSSITDLANLVPAGTVEREGFATRNASAGSTAVEVNQWVNRIMGK